MEDNIAVSRIKQGDLNGLEILVRRYQVQAVHASYLILFDKTGAEDIVQKAFVKVVEHIHQYDENRPFAPWFLRIVVNDSLKLAEKQGRSISLDEVLDQRTAQLARWLTDPEPGPELRLEQEEMRQDILNAVRSLPPGQRAAIVMRYFLDLSMAETSTKMGRPLSTIKWWLRDGRRRLRELVDIPEVDRS
jgi:RNA polymerase sigma-70 factor (ECF subfamily)